MKEFSNGSMKALTKQEISRLIELRKAGEIDISDVHILAESRKWELYSFICYSVEAYLRIVPKHYNDVSVRCGYIHSLVDEYYEYKLSDLEYDHVWKVFQILKEDGYLEKQGDGYALGIDPETFDLSTREVKRLEYIKTLLKNGGEIKIENEI